MCSDSSSDDWEHLGNDESEHMDESPPDWLQRAAHELKLEDTGLARDACDLPDDLPTFAVEPSPRRGTSLRSDLEISRQARLAIGRWTVVLLTLPCILHLLCCSLTQQLASLSLVHSNVAPELPNAIGAQHDDSDSDDDDFELLKHALKGCQQKLQTERATFQTELQALRRERTELRTRLADKEGALLKAEALAGEAATLKRSSHRAVLIARAARRRADEAAKTNARLEKELAGAHKATKRAKQRAAMQRDAWSSWWASPPRCSRRRHSRHTCGDVGVDWF